MNADRLDSRAWLLWGLAAMLPMLVSRHPLVVLQMLVIVVAVRLVWADRLARGWGWIARMAAVFVLVGVVFNALTVHAGDQVLFRIPDSIPLVGGVVTLNAVVYGFVTGIAMLTLVLTGTTIAAGLAWSELVRSLPSRVAPLAVAGSVAWSFLPGASRAFVDIRESQASRGHRLRGARDVPQLVVPLIEGGLERALTMSEALEARGFGASPADEARRAPQGWTSVVVIAGLVTSAYALAMGRGLIAFAGAAVAIAAAFVLARGGDRLTPKVRYRALRWSMPDRVVAGGAGLAAAGFLWRQAVSGEAAIFNPYPHLVLPPLDPLMVLFLAVLLVPAVITPAAGETR
jgi:energy-coupling factor transport system permease protein